MLLDSSVDELCSDRSEDEAKTSEADEVVIGLLDASVGDGTLTLLDSGFLLVGGAAEEELEGTLLDVVTGLED